jgi:hypothetical protein
VFGVHASFWSETFSADTPCGEQTWTGNAFDHGQGPGAGNITGCFFFPFPPPHHHHHH